MHMPPARDSTDPQAAPCTPRRQQGFTLVELVICAGLVGFLAVTATYLWVDSFGLARTVNTDSAAIADGRALLERLAREIREVKFNPASGTYCVSTMSVTQMVFNKTVGSVAAACSGPSPTNANNDIAVNIQVPANTTTLNLGYAGTLAAPAATRALTSYASSFGLRYLDGNYTETNSAGALRFVEVSLTLRPPSGRDTQTRTVVALRND